MSADRRREAFDLLRDAARRRAVLASLVFLAVFVAGAEVGLSLPPLYRASATLVVEPGRGDPTLPGEISGRLETIRHTVLSRSPLLEQAHRFGLYSELAARGLSDAIVEQMLGDIRVQTQTTPDPSGHGTLVGLTLSYRGRDPGTAARVSNSLAALFLEQDALLRSQRYAGRATLLKQHLAELRQRLDGSAAGSTDRPRAPTADDSQLLADATAFDRLGLQLRAVRDDRRRAVERREGLLKQLADADPQSERTARLARMQKDL